MVGLPGQYPRNSMILKKGLLGMLNEVIYKMRGTVTLQGLTPSAYIVLGAALLVSCQETLSMQQGADLILENARVYTVNEAQPWAETVAIKDKHIVYVGSSDGAKAYETSETEIIDLGGKMVMPGIIDTHIHALGVVKPNACDLETHPYSLNEIVPILQDCLVRYDIKPGERMTVLQWAFSGGNQPSEEYPTMRAALDAVSTEHSIVLSGDDGHHNAYNSFALAEARDREGKFCSHQ